MLLIFEEAGGGKTWNVIDKVPLPTVENIWTN